MLFYASQEDAKTEKAFISRRRKKAGAGSCAVLEARDEAALAAADLMNASDSIQREITFQHNKQYMNRIQAYLDGALLQSEIPEDMQHVAQAFLDKQGEVDRKRVRKKQLQCDKLALSTPRIQPIHKVWVEDEAWAESFGRFTYTADPAQALFFAVKEISQPPPLILWSIVLQGGFMIDVRHLEHQFLGQAAAAADHGASFVYDPAVKTQRHVLVSPKFRERCPKLSAVVDAACVHRLSQWRKLDSWEAFATRCASNGKNSFKAIALATKAEVKALDRRNVFDQDGLLKFLRKVACAYNLTTD